MAEVLSAEREAAFGTRVESAQRFFMGEADVQRALERLARKPKPVAFPNPAEAAVSGRRVALLPLNTLVELKLASGISAPHRLKDLADVLELIRALSLPRDLSQSLDPSVRTKYEELWQAAQTADRE